MNGCLVVHSLAATPATVAPLQEALLANGFRVSMPRLAGHGGSLEELARSTWQDWYGTVHDAFMTLKRECDRVFFAGFSLGSLLGLRLAIDEGLGVRALVLAATPIRFRPFYRLGIGMVRNSPLRWIIHAVPRKCKRHIADPVQRERYEQFSSHTIPMQSLYEIESLQRSVVDDLPRLTNPLLLVHGRGDKLCPPSYLDLITKRVASDIMETVVFPRSLHAISLDGEREQALTRAVEFFKRFE